MSYVPLNKSPMHCNILDDSDKAIISVADSSITDDCTPTDFIDDFDAATRPMLHRLQPFEYEEEEPDFKLNTPTYDYERPRSHLTFSFDDEQLKKYQEWVDEEMTNATMPKVNKGQYAPIIHRTPDEWSNPFFNK